MGGLYRRILACCVGVVIAVALAAAPAAAQRVSLGLEGGGTSVDDRRGLHPGFGVSLLWPMGRMFAGALSYTQWFPGGPEPEPTALGSIGERGITLTAHLRAAQSERLLWLVGGGLGHYERVVTSADAIGHSYDGALTVSTIFMVRMTERTAAYLRAEASTPTGEWDATWGALHAGLALPLF